MGEAFLGHLEELAKKLDYVGSDDTARFSAAFRWVACFFSWPPLANAAWS